MSTSTATTTSPARHWPALAGLVAAALAIAAGPGRETVAITVAVAATCYLAAAAFGRAWVAWAAIPVASVLVVVGGLLLGLPPWATLGLTALVLVGVGLLGREPPARLGLEAAGFVLYAGVATLGLALGPQVGLVVVGLTLVGHGVWDIAHWRRRLVVPRSLAQACVFLDVPLGLAAVGMGLVG
jgi:hypothetical protein